MAVIRQFGSLEWMIFFVVRTWRVLCLEIVRSRRRCDVGYFRNDDMQEDNDVSIKI